MKFKTLFGKRNSKMVCVRGGVGIRLNKNHIKLKYNDSISTDIQYFVRERTRINIIRSYKWSRSGVVSEVSGVDNLDRVIILFLDSHS